MQILLNFLTNAIKFSDIGKTIVLRLALLDVQGVSEKIGERNEILNADDSEETEKYAKFRIDIEDNGAGI
jgi:signal transduction histidine kinase